MTVPATLVVGDAGDSALLDSVIAEYRIETIAHFAAKIVVPDSVANPLLYYLNNTIKARSLLECAVRGNVKHFTVSPTSEKASPLSS